MNKNPKVKYEMRPVNLVLKYSYLKKPKIWLPYSLYYRYLKIAVLFLRNNQPS